ncbi:hypothetical protein TWF481_000071 [Arthrobotrys musiformis]|uniref:Uncharacterized protein n=1 Tax=Arthrobotrys musiformis TaxID=47236 RepID=A0AAV9WMK9_9PEZI
MPPKRTERRARSAQGRLHGAPYRRSRPSEAAVTTITVTAPPTPTSGGGGVQTPITPPEGSASQVTAGMPFDIRMFLRARRIAAGGSHSSTSPFLLGGSRETASPRPRSLLQRRRHGSEPLPGLPVALQRVSRSGIEKTTKSSRQFGPGSSPRPNATSSQRKSTKSRATRSRRLTEAEAVRLFDEAGSARTERLRSDQRRSGVRDQGRPMTPPGARPHVAEQPTENGNGEEAGLPTRRLVRRGARQTGRIAREQPLEAPASAENNAQQTGARRTVRRRRAVTTNTGAPVAVRNGRQLGAEGRVAPVVGERVLTLTNPAAVERYARDVLQLRRRVEETFVPEGQRARAPAPQVTQRHEESASQRSP